MSESDQQSLLARLAPWAVTLAVTIAALWLTGRVLALRVENQSLATERTLAEVAYKLGQNQLAERTLLAENMINDLGRKLRHAEDLARLKVVALNPPAASSGDGRAFVVWDPEQQTGLLTAEKLPALPGARVYQIWIIDPASLHPVAGGIFRVTAEGRAVLGFRPEKPVSLAGAFSISAEEREGEAHAASRVVLEGR